MWRPEFLYSLYEHTLKKQLNPDQLPSHVGIILDGNRRWARELGSSASMGHRKGADHIAEVLSWCEEVGIELVTLWMLSTENFSRAAEELDELIDIIVAAVENLAALQRWDIRVIGDLGLLPAAAANRLRAAAQQRPEGIAAMKVNVAIGYGGRHEIASAVQSYLLDQAEQGISLHDVAQNFTAESINEHMYTKGQPDPDLIIRTSGEQRLSGFMLWQAVHSELYFCETYWPDFRRTDLLRAVRDYSQRERRLGK
ncbi:MAG: isoprenyl transferase [Trueperella sp.]|nr:isoprenyl transferase [Trueperella sp.]